MNVELDTSKKKRSKCISTTIFDHYYTATVIYTNMLPLNLHNYN